MHKIHPDARMPQDTDPVLRLLAVLRMAGH